MADRVYRFAEIPNEISDKGHFVDLKINFW